MPGTGATCDAGETRTGTLPVQVVQAVALGAARGLVHAHAANVVQRDIKPENLMLCRDGTIKLMDFGIASVIAADGHAERAESVGTQLYMAPEQYRAGGLVDHRADQYALGVTLNEALAGNAPGGRMRPII